MNGGKLADRVEKIGYATLIAVAIAVAVIIASLI
jgi:cell division protein FtsL